MNATKSSPLDPPNYAKRVQQLERQGLTTNDAQGVANAEILRHGAVQLDPARLIQQGQWSVRISGGCGRNAECLELEGFGIVGAVIDIEGNNIILNRALACSDLLAESAAFVADFQAYIDSDDYDLPDPSALLAAIATARGLA